MNLGDLRQTFRLEADDNVEEFLFLDEEIDGWANDAVMEAARRARLLVDSRTTEVCQANVSANNPWVDIDSRIIFVRRAILQGSSQPLCKVQQRDLDARVPGWETSAATTPTHFIQGIDSAAIRLWPPPKAAGKLNMTVVREPLAAMEAEDDEPEIPARYHRSLVYWMLHKAYSKPDSDFYDDKLAMMNEAKFVEEFGRRSSALDEEWIAAQYGADDYEGLF